MNQPGLEDNVKDKNFIKTGGVGAAIMGLCCFTPLLVVGLGAIGLSAWLAWVDYILFPSLFFSYTLAAPGKGFSGILPLCARTPNQRSDPCQGRPCR